MTSHTEQSTISGLQRPVVSPAAAIEAITSGSTVFVGGWGGVGVPSTLLATLARTPADRLVIVANNCGMGHTNDVGVLFGARKVAKAISSFPTHPSAEEFRGALEETDLEVELVPQGTLVERIRSAGSGLGGFFTPAGAGTLVGKDKEERVIGGRLHVFEEPLRADFALIHAHTADHYGNLRYRYSAGAFNATMAMAADTVIVEVEELSSAPLDPERIATPGIFVDVLTVVGNDLSD